MESEVLEGTNPKLKFNTNPCECQKFAIKPPWSALIKKLQIFDPYLTWVKTLQLFD